MPAGAKTGISRDQSASVDIILQKVNQNLGGTNNIAISGITVEHFFGAVTVVMDRIFGSDLDPPNPPKAYYTVRATISVFAPFDPTPDDTTVVEVYSQYLTGAVRFNNQPYVIPCEFGVGPVYLWESHTETPGRNNDNNVTHLMECAGADVWYADEDTEITVTAGGMSAVSGLTGESAGDIELSDADWRLKLSVSKEITDAASTAHMTFDNILVGDIPPDCGQCNQSAMSSGWDTGRGWSAVDSRAWIMAGSGDKLVLSSGSLADSGTKNNWEGYIGQPRALDLSELYVRRFCSDNDYPDAEVRVVGCVDWNGNTLVDTAANLRAMGVIVDPTVYSWIAESPGDVPPYVAWSGWKPATVLRLQLDEAWAKLNAEYRGDGEGLDDLYIPLYGWPVDAGDRSTDPFFSDLVDITHLDSVNVNDPPTTTIRTVAKRPSLWVGSGGVTVNPANNDEWTVAADASGPEVSRGLIGIFFDRLNACKAGGATPPYEGGELPTCFLRNKANMDPNWPVPGNETEEDVTCFDNHSWLRVGFVVPQAATLTMRVEWVEVTSLSDNKTTTRNEDLEWSQVSRSAEYEVPFTGTGSQTYDVDLPRVPPTRETTIMRHVTRITFSGFPADTVWTLEELTLQRKMFAHLKLAEPWTYTEGCLSGVVDGKIVLQLLDDYRSNQENGLPGINWAFSGAGDVSSAYTLQQFVDILNQQEGFEASLDDSAREAHYEDDESPANVLCVPKWWHLKSQAHLGSGSFGSWPGAITVGAWTTVPGIVYKPYCEKLIQAGAHGTLWSGASRDSESTVYLWRRPYGRGEPWDHFATLEPDDEDWPLTGGYWRYCGLKVLNSQGASPPADDLKWEYGFATVLDDSQVTSLGTGWNREWMVQAYVSTIFGFPDLTVDPFGRVWRVHLRDGAVVVHWRDRDEAGAWRDAGTALSASAGEWSYPTIGIRPSGDVLVAATANGGMVWRRARTHTGGSAGPMVWEAVA